MISPSRPLLPCRWPHLVVVALAAIAICKTNTAVAHEFWLQMVTYQPAVGDSVPIIHRAGENFAGNSYPYLRDDTRRFGVVTSRGETPIKSIEGNDPAGEFTFKTQGLTTIVYHGADNHVVFKTFDKFKESLRFEGLERFIPLHAQRGKPVVDIREQYTRCAKALVAVGRGNGKDRAVGLPLELIAQKNPYKIKFGDALPVQLLFGGKPLSGATVKLFSHDNPSKPRRFQTDGNGLVKINLPKRGEYMVHAVHMRDPIGKENAHWASLWASLTFFRP